MSVKQKLLEMCPCPKNDLFVNVRFYSDDADMLRDLATELILSREELVCRLTLLGLAQLLDEGAPEGGAQDEE